MAAKPVYGLVFGADMKAAIMGESSGAIRDALLAVGVDAISCDLLPTDKPGPHYQGDMFDIIDYPWDLAIFHIPCTNTAVSGAKHFAAKCASDHADINKAGDLLGHQSVSMTKAVYDRSVRVVRPLK